MASEAFQLEPPSPREPSLPGSSARSSSRTNGQCLQRARTTRAEICVRTSMQYRSWPTILSMPRDLPLDAVQPDHGVVVAPQGQREACSA